MQPVRMITILCLCCLTTFLYGYESQDSSYTYERIESMIKEGRAAGDFKLLAHAYYQRGLSNAKVLINQDKVTDDLRLSTIYFKYIKDSINYYKARSVLAEVYIEQENYFGEALEMLLEAEEYFKKQGLSKEVVKTLTSISQVHEKKQDYELALKYIYNALDLNQEVRDTSAEVENAITISKLMNALGNTEQAIDFTVKNYETSLLIDEPDLTAEILYQLGIFYERINQYDKALEKYNSSLELTKSGTSQMAFLFQRLGDCYARVEDFGQALAYQKKFNSLNDSLLNKQRIALTNRLALEYQTLEKEKEISNLERQRELNELRLSQQQRLTITLLAFIIAGLLAAFYIIRFYRQKIKINEILSKQRAQIDRQTIQQLEDDLKIRSLQSMVDGQEVERKRIANDLHDSLGGMLSTLKLQFDALQYDHDELGEDKSYSHINNMIDDACSEVRKIARNLKPAALENIGFEAAVKDLINRYQSSGSLEISFHSDKIDGRINNESKLHMYRIVQELLNNALKHSEANEIDIQLSRQNGHLILKVEDDGVGFDKDDVELGLGLDNIQSRVNVLQGEMNIDSKAGEGTSVIIHVPVNFS